MVRLDGDGGVCNGAAPPGFGAVVDEHHARVYRFLLKLVGNPADAQDLTQQTFLEAYRGFSGFRGDSSLSSWLHGIALNLARNHRRGVRARRLDEQVEVPEDLPAATVDPETDAITRELLRRAMAALNDLPADTRIAFALVALDGRTYEEAAESLGVPVATIRGRVARARAKIREAVGVT